MVMPPSLLFTAPSGHESLLHGPRHSLHCPHGRKRVFQRGDCARPCSLLESYHKQGCKNGIHQRRGLPSLAGFLGNESKWGGTLSGFGDAGWSSSREPNKDSKDQPMQGARFFDKATTSKPTPIHQYDNCRFWISGCQSLFERPCKLNEHNKMDRDGRHAQVASGNVSVPRLQRSCSFFSLLELKQARVAWPLGGMNASEN